MQSSRQWLRDGHGAERQRGARLREPPPRKTHPGSFPSVEECACSCFFEQFRETFFCFRSLTEGCRKAYTRACGGGCPQFGSTLAKASACADSMYSAGCCVLHLLHGALAQGLVSKDVSLIGCMRKPDTAEFTAMEGSRLGAVWQRSMANTGCNSCVVTVQLRQRGTAEGA